MLEEFIIGHQATMISLDRRQLGCGRSGVHALRQLGEVACAQVVLIEEIHELVLKAVLYFPLGHHGVVSAALNASYQR